MQQKIAISCFDYTTNMMQPWAEAGYLCYCVDMQHPAGETRTGNIVRVGADMMHWLPPRGEIAFAAFFPPCTDVAVSGARWFRDKGLGKLIGALTLFKRSVDLAELIGAPYMLENPVSTVSSYWRKPDHVFDPCDYGDPYTKKTCLWTGGGFVMPPKARVEPTEGSKMHLLPTSEERANLRSATPMGFARAVFEANARRLQCASSDAERRAKRPGSRSEAEAGDLPMVGDLAMLVARLARKLRKATPADELPAQALDYLNRNGLKGSPLRKVGAGEAAADDEEPEWQNAVQAAFGGIVQTPQG